MILKTGDIILQEKPFAFALDKNSVSEYCSNCLIKGKLLSCSKCKTIKYCSKACQLQDWQCHKMECKHILPVVIYDEEIHLTFRIFARMKKLDMPNPLCINSHITIPKMDFENLPISKVERSWVSTYTDVLEFTRVVEALGVDEKNIKNLYEIRKKIIRNSIPLFDSTYEKIGTALYLNASQFHHKCVPNAVALFNGPNIVISLIQDVDMDTTDDFLNKIFISYLDPYKTFCDRQNLLERMGRQCICQLCLRHDELGDSDVSFLPEYSIFDDKTILERFQQQHITDFLDNVFDKLFSRASKLKKRLVIFPKSTNVYYNRKLLNSCRTLLSTNFSYPNSLAYIALLTILQGNIREYYPQNSVYMVKLLFCLHRQAIVQKDRENANKFALELKTIINALFPDSYFQGLKISDGLDSFPKYAISKLKEINI